MRTLRSVRTLLASVKPDLIHAVGHKAVLHSVFGRTGITRAPLIQAVSGLGSAMLARRGNPWRLVIGTSYKFARSDPTTWTLFQNEADRAAFLTNGWAAPERSVLIAGSGVDFTEFKPSAHPPDGRLVVLPARMLGDKGVREFVSAARALSTHYPDVRFALVGAADTDNPSAIPQDELEHWVRMGAVEWWGHCRDMKAVYTRAAIVALPSYREGLSKALIEAAACGCAIVTTDVPGCREIVNFGKCGELVPVGDSATLARAIAGLLDDAARRQRLGREARLHAEQNYDVRLVIRDTLALYARALGS